MNDTLNPYGLKFNNNSNLVNLYAAVGNRGSRGGWDRARERAIANREYTLTKGRDNRYYLKF
jgi:predicted secreted Zn-dependent protease